MRPQGPTYQGHDIRRGCLLCGFAIRAGVCHLCLLSCTCRCSQHLRGVGTGHTHACRGWLLWHSGSRVEVLTFAYSCVCNADRILACTNVIRQSAVAHKLGWLAIRAAWLCRPMGRSQEPGRVQPDQARVGSNMTAAGIPRPPWVYSNQFTTVPPKSKRSSSPPASPPPTKEASKTSTTSTAPPASLKSTPSAPPASSKTKVPNAAKPPPPGQLAFLLPSKAGAVL